jgi:hypothetical protein
MMPVAGTLSDEAVYDSRKRICNKGYLLKSHFATLEDGSIKETYVCPAMPERQYVKLGGKSEETIGRGCLCNGLFSTAGLGEANEPAIITLGVEGASVVRSLTAREVIADILTPQYVADAERRLAKNSFSGLNMVRPAETSQNRLRTYRVRPRLRFATQ